MKADLLDTKGKEIEQIEIPESVFGEKPNPTLVAQAVRVYLANQRQGNASTKTRGEVHGSSRKIYKQKGTGRARQGSIRAPHRVGGGIAFGPVPHDFGLDLPQKMKKKALNIALSDKLRDGKIIFIDGLEKLKGRTKEAIEVLTALKLPRKKILFVLPERIELLERSLRNIQKVSYEKVNLINTYSVLNSDYLIFLKDAVAEMK